MRVIKRVLGPVHISGQVMTLSHTDDQSTLSYSDTPPILVAATSDAALARAVRGAQASGCRIGASLNLCDARERIERQVSASTVWLELDRDFGAEMDMLLDSVAKDAAEGRYRAVVSTTA